MREGGSEGGREGGREGVREGGREGWITVVEHMTEQCSHYTGSPWLESQCMASNGG